jgi:hypothetical protein
MIAWFNDIWERWFPTPPRVFALALSRSGSEHIVSGGIRKRRSYNWRTAEEAQAHLARIEWTDVRLSTDVKTTDAGLLIITWDNGSKTEHQRGKGTFVYLKGGPPAGSKISKSNAVEGPPAKFTPPANWVPGTPYFQVRPKAKIPATPAEAALAKEFGENLEIILKNQGPRSEVQAAQDQIQQILKSYRDLTQ